MAETEELRRMREAIELWNEGDYEAVLTYQHPDTVWRLDPVFPDLDRVYEGREGVRQGSQSPLVAVRSGRSVGVDTLH